MGSRQLEQEREDFHAELMTTLLEQWQVRACLGLLPHAPFDLAAHHFSCLGQDRVQPERVLGYELVAVSPTGHLAGAPVAPFVDECAKDTIRHMR
jgi:hypothetical protein